MRLKSLLPFLIWITFSACKSDVETTSYTYSLPEGLLDWEVATLEEAGMDQSIIEDLAESIVRGEFPEVHSMLIAKGGKLVFEDYFNGFERDDLHVLFSATKSYASTLLGIAIDRGEISSVDVPIVDFFPEKQSFFNEEKENMTIKDLLTMTSGLEWDEWSTSGLDAENSHEQMMTAPSQIDFVLNLPSVNKPGALFTYNTGLSNLMAPIIENASGQPVEVYLNEHLFAKLNIATFHWEEVIDNYPSTGGSRGGLEMLPKDMIKLGQLFLNRGKWNGEQVVSEQWVEQAIKPRIEQSNSIHYGYQWWNRTYFTKDGSAVEEYDAVGDGGQWIFIFEEFDLVIAFTAGNYTWDKGPDLMFQHVNMVQHYILPAIK